MSRTLHSAAGSRSHMRRVSDLFLVRHRFKKPVDLRAKRAKLLNGKRDVLKISVDFQQ